MKRLIALLILLVTINLSAQIKNEYYENGQVRATGEMKNNSRFGDWKLYHSNGVVSGTITYDSNGFPIPETFKTYNEKGEKVSCDCPEPTQTMYSAVCHSIYERQAAQISGPAISYGYQEKLWQMSCAKVGIDKLEIARIKIQIMWNKYREKFRCYNYPTMVSSEKNIMKFTMDSGLSAMLTESVKRYKLNMNFLDPGDHKTVLDFLYDREKDILNSPPIDESRAAEYKQVYELLKANGAKHALELNK